MSGNDVIIPKNSYKEVNYGLLTFLNVVVGIIIGAAMVYFLVLPAKEKTTSADYKNEMNAYADKVAMQNITISDLERQVEALTTEKESIQSQLDQANASKTDTTLYDSVLAAAAKYFANDFIGSADILYTINVSTSSSQNLIGVYNNLCTATYETAGNHYNNVAYQAFNTGNYAEAIPAFEKAVVFTPQNVDLMYNLGKCYKAENGGKNNDKSIACFDKVIEMAPGTDYATWANGQKKD